MYNYDSSKNFKYETSEEKNKMILDFDDTIPRGNLLSMLNKMYLNNRFYGPTLLDHVALVALLAASLAPDIGGNGPLVYLASWLHDIGAAMEGPHEHHRTGAEIAARMLYTVGYPDEIIRPIQVCLFTHRGSMEIEKPTIEAKLVASGDGVAHFFRISDLFWVAFNRLGLDAAGAGDWVGYKLERSWKKMLPRHQKLVESHSLAGTRRNLSLIFPRPPAEIDLDH